MSVANAYNGFFVNYFSAAWGLVKGLQAVKGNISPSQVPLQKALGKVSLNGPFGKVTLDSNRQAIEGEWSYQIGAKPGKPPTVKTVQYIPNVNQTFSGLFSSSPASWPHAAAVQEGEAGVGRKGKACRQRSHQVGRGRSNDRGTTAVQCRRPSACGGSAGGLAGSTPCAT